MKLHLIADLEANKDRFIRRVRETGQVWILGSDSGLAHCGSHEKNVPVALFWSDRAYAQRHALEKWGWGSYEAHPLELESFLEAWLPGLQEDDMLVGVNFNEDLAGVELEPMQLRAELMSAS
jgi:hypothetical protein